MNEFKQIFPLGKKNDAFARYFIGQSYLAPLTLEGVMSFNVTFEPGCRNNWHIHHSKSGGGQMLVCTAGEGWFQKEGKKPVSIIAGSVIYIPTGAKHWHGAKTDSWFSHISLEVPGTESSNEWLEPVTDEYYNTLPGKGNKLTDNKEGNKIKYSSKKEFREANVFGMGMKNFMLSKYFSGRSYLKMMTMPGKTPIFLANVSFEPGCRNNWHIHHKGGQILYCTVGTGWYQEKGKPARLLKPGDVVYIPAEVNHWHGATNDSWFAHISLNVPAEGGKVEWLEPVKEDEYKLLNG
jgi:quercetin dioxygenase-like cupin family protein